MSPLLLLLLPVLATARIHIEITGSMTPRGDNMDVLFSGSERNVISEKEQTSFRLNDNTLKKAIEEYFGQRPDDAFVRSPTPWGDLFMSYDRKPVTRTLKPRSARVLELTREPQIVMRQVFENNSTKPATFDVGISQTVENTVSSSWMKSSELSISEDIAYEFNIEVMKAEGKTDMKYMSSWGEDMEKSQKISVGAKSAMNVMLNPGQSVMTELQATRGVLKVEVEYEARLSGNAAVNYNDEFKGHHFWFLDVESVMKAGGLENRLISKEVIEIGFYADSRITVLDNELKIKMLDLQL